MQWQLPDIREVAHLCGPVLLPSGVSSAFIPHAFRPSAPFDTQHPRRRVPHRWFRAKKKKASGSPPRPSDRKSIGLERSAAPEAIVQPDRHQMNVLLDVENPTSARPTQTEAWRVAAEVHEVIFDLG